MPTAATTTPTPPPLDRPRKAHPVIKALASLRLTVALLVLAMLLIFFATLDQVNLGIHFVQEKYFKSFFALAPLPYSSTPVLPLPGGYAIGAALMVNLLCAHALRFKLNAKKAGITLIHSGLIVLILGQFFTGIVQKETQMRFSEGETTNYSQDPRQTELAIIDVTDPQAQVATVIPDELLRAGATFSPEALPFQLHITQYFPNSRLGMRAQNPDVPPTPEVNRGLGGDLAAWGVKRATAMDERDIPTAFVDVRTPAGESLGKWLVSNYFIEARAQAPIFAQPQQFEFQDRTFVLEMRRRREYKPFQLTLLDFTHDRYAGTEIPKNFSSHVRLVDPTQGEDRQVLIFMNNPLRYAGYTFYQALYEGERTSILQVVENPFWLTPYLGCLMVASGMTLQFTMHLVGFMRKRRRQAAGTAAAPVGGPSSGPEVELPA